MLTKEQNHEIITSLMHAMEHEQRQLEWLQKTPLEDEAMEVVKERHSRQALTYRGMLERRIAHHGELSDFNIDEINPTGLPQR